MNLAPKWAPRLFAWQAWHLATWTVAGVALGDIDLHFASQAWHLVTWTFTSRRRRGTWWHGRALCVAGVALMALGWLWWRAWFPWSPRLFAWQAWHLATWTVAGVALGDIDLHFASQAWHLVTWTFTSRRRRGTWWHRPSLCVAGVALGDMDVHFAWQAWHLWHWAGSGGALGSRGRRGSLRRRRGTWRHGPWQAWHLVTSTFTLRRRRGTWWHGRALCMAGVALMALGWLWWRAWFPVGAAALCVAGVALGDMDRGRRGTWWHRPSLCVAGVALGDMDRGRRGTWRHGPWQAWHLVTSTFTLRRRRGTWRHGPWQAWHLVTSTFTLRRRRGTWRHGPWQAWHLVTSTFTLRRRRGTWWHGRALCVAGRDWRRGSPGGRWTRLPADHPTGTSARSWSRSTGRCASEAIFLHRNPVVDLTLGISELEHVQKVGAAAIQGALVDQWIWTVNWSTESTGKVAILWQPPDNEDQSGSKPNEVTDAERAPRTSRWCATECEWSTGGDETIPNEMTMYGIFTYTWVIKCPHWTSPNH